MSNRHKARELALQGLYAIEMNPETRSEVSDLFWVNEKDNLESDVVAYTAYLVSGVLENLPEIDQNIKVKLKRWDFGRIAKVDLSILRLGVFQLLFQQDVPGKVVIDEMIRISKKFSSPESYRFVNGILDAIRKNGNQEI